MAKFVKTVVSDHASFCALKDELTAALAGEFLKVLASMGEDAKGVSWFSSCAENYCAQNFRKAA